MGQHRAAASTSHSAAAKLWPPASTTAQADRRLCQAAASADRLFVRQFVSGCPETKNEAYGCSYDVPGIRL